MKFKFLLFSILAYFLSLEVIAQRQPEQYSFESTSTTDLVNLSTGSFTYTIPLINIPGTQGGFSMPLSYHAGIRPDDEASWVGLGWSINPGLIARDVIGIPDDAYFTMYKEHIDMPISHGWRTDYFGVFGESYNSELGYGGFISLKGVTVGWGTQEGISALGLSLKDGKLKTNNFDAEQIISSILQNQVESAVANMSGIAGQAKDLATKQWLQSTLNEFQARAASMNTVHAPNNSNINRNFTKNMTTTETNWVSYFKEVTTTFIDKNMFSYGIGSLYSGGSHRVMPAEYRRMLQPEGYQMSRIIQFEQNSVDIPLTEFKTAININNNETEGKYDRIYANSIDASFFRNQYYLPIPLVLTIDYVGGENGVQPFDYNDIYATTDIHEIPEDIDRIIENPISVAYDNYTVMAGDISGAITPYRMEISNVARNSYSNKTPISIAVFDDYSEKKVEFKYLNDFGNSYTFHNQADGIYVDEGANSLRINVNKPQFIIPLIHPDYGKNETPALEQRRRIRWFSNAEIKEAINNNKGFLDYTFPHPERSLDNKRIGGFIITNEKGYSYHFSLPVYESVEQEYSFVSETDCTIKKEPVKDYSNAFSNVNTVLLTAITGPDFIDVNGNSYIDDYDYGYWVKFNYSNTGKFKSRTPYEGEKYSVSNINDKYYKIIERDNYYLKSIETKSHVGVFSISQRNDSRGMLHEILNVPKGVSFKLDDFYLFTRSDYEYLLNNGLEDDSDTKIFSTERFDIIRDLIAHRQISRVNFRYNYSLCKNYPSSFTYDLDLETGIASNFDNSIGKLTLKSIINYGNNDLTVSPPYNFDYHENNLSDNPSYSIENWDGWGYYKGNGEKSLIGHFATNEGDQWSLKEITTPIGSKIIINYERNTYSSVCGFPIRPQIFNIKRDNYNVSNNRDRKSLKLLDPYQVIAVANYAKENGLTELPCIGSLNDAIPVTKVTCSDNSVVAHRCDGVTDEDYSFYGATIYFEANPVPFTWGAGIRVKSIEVTDNNASYITEYKYNKFGTSTSSGVVSSEPDFCRRGSDFYSTNVHKQYDYPNHILIYENVEVIMHDDNTKKYYFEPPKSNHFFMTKNTIGIENDIDITYKFSDFDSEGECFMHPNAKNLEVKINTSAIGRVNKIEEFNSNDILLHMTSYEYYKPDELFQINNMGMYSQGTFLASLQMHGKYTRGGYEENSGLTHDIILSTKNYIPGNIIKETFSFDKGITTSLKNEKFDFNTGIPTKYTTNLIVNNNIIHSFSNERLLAYKLYDGLHLANMWDYDYANIITQNGNVIGAKIQTWKGDWDNYTYWDGNNNQIGYNGNDSKDDGSSVNIWRKHKSFAWQGDLDTDGTYANFTGYDTPEELQTNFPGWANPDYSGIGDNANGWKMTSEVVRYDHFSSPLEVKDINGDYATTKKDPEHMYTTASAANASYASIGATGFEYSKVHFTNGIYYLFEGEVISHAEIPVKVSYDELATETQMITGIVAHTGDKYGYITPGVVGCRYTGAQSAQAELIRGCDYRAAVWVHKNSPGSLNLHATVDGTTFTNETYIGQYGDWRLYYLDFNVPATATSFTVWADATTADIYIDDFRVAPFESALTTYTYDNAGQVTAIINNDNFATKYEYDAGGRLTGIFRETNKGFERISSHKYHYSNMFTVNYELGHYSGEGYELDNFTKYGGKLYFTVNNSLNESWSYTKPSWITEISKGSDYLELSIAPNSNCTINAGNIEFLADNYNQSFPIIQGYNQDGGAFQFSNFVPLPAEATNEQAASIVCPTDAELTFEITGQSSHGGNIVTINALRYILISGQTKTITLKVKKGDVLQCFITHNAIDPGDFLSLRLVEVSPFCNVSIGAINTITLGTI
jgi:YD repeat-containing protein